MSERKREHQEMLRQYIQGELKPEEQNEIDRLLLEDGAFLLEYMNAFEKLEQRLPALEDPVAFSDQVMKQLPQKPKAIGGQSKLLSSKWNWLKHPVTHYAAAASITFLMLTSGVFDHLSSSTEKVWTHHDKPLSEKWLDQATGWLDQWNKRSE
ncbi:anti-sigma factor [Paenibacillus tuaregi]|uniref:hypothetical protein n=1 Tax=Paenibacillus tuaregi TaxID=1816681 RepID=UPI0008394D08|nr:hypothetical protein [Paenibacillus tuaregi]